ncbi:hypothetical protein BDV41DRAFT_579314 [Aspergillus transmontanensis]|uniref:N-acetyltransferase domain-containing protein n=1 Tax=Aspergillus transmontanensis TaxID=1034304 RepID=A0A5N6VRR6_9EURO|nr:hypothetical protein BDV41DRAFT_579314 [Aspergillus transmontanensis]
MISKSLTAGIEVSRMTDLQHASQLSSILIDAFSHDELFKIECPDESSINDMKTQTKSTIESIVQNTGSGGASVWTAQTESGQIVGYAQWKHAVCLLDQDTEQHECSGSLLSAPELYGNLSATKRAVLMKYTPFHYLEVIAVDPKCQAKGIGALLVRRFSEECEDMPIYCEASAHVAPFYRKLGFEALDSFSVPLNQERSLEVFCMRIEPKTVPPHARYSPNGTRYQ